MILITGGTGFIGSQLIQQLIASGKTVRAIKREHSIIPENLRNQQLIEWVEADILDYFSLSDAFEGIQQVYHCAAVVSYASEDKKLVLTTNVEGTTHIVNLCLEHQCRLLHVSSVAALGDNEKGKAISEKTYWNWSSDKSTYSISKFESEREVWRGISEGLNAVIINPSIVIGATKGRSESNRIFELLEDNLSYFPSGSSGFIDVIDVVNIMIQLMESPTITEESYLLNNENLSYQELFSRYAKIAHKKITQRPLSPVFLELAWRLLIPFRALKLSTISLSKEIAHAATKKSVYDNTKVRNSLSYSFKPLDQSFQEIHESLQ